MRKCEANNKEYMYFEEANVKGRVGVEKEGRETERSQTAIEAGKVERGGREKRRKSRRREKVKRNGRQKDKGMSTKEEEKMTTNDDLFEEKGQDREEEKRPKVLLSAQVGSLPLLCFVAMGVPPPTMGRKFTTVASARFAARLPPSGLKSTQHQPASSPDFLCCVNSFIDL